MDQWKFSKWKYKEKSKKERTRRPKNRVTIEKNITYLTRITENEER
jgi:hypothetical protein